jgi:PadR family transcriptional regulator AphA
MTVSASKAEPFQPLSRGPSLAEYLVLGLIAERPAHGFAVARVVARDGPIGRVYEIPRPVVYRSISRLVEAGLVQPRGVERGQGGPQRTVLRITPRGRRVLRAWLSQPVEHVRDLRTEFLAKLALLERVGADRGPLLADQRRVVAPIVAALAEQQQTVRNFDRTVLAWRYQAAQAAIRFLDDLDGLIRPPERRTGVSRGTSRRSVAQVS